MSSSAVSYEFDASSLVHQSQFNPAPKHDPLEAVLIVDDFQSSRENWDRDHYCNRCDDWDTPGLQDEKNSKRPPGVMSHSACNGCVFSHLQRIKPTAAVMRKLQGRLHTRWAEARANLELHLQGRWKAATKPKLLAKWLERRQKLEHEINLCYKACLLAEFDPHHRRRGALMVSGDEIPVPASDEQGTEALAFSDPEEPTLPRPGLVHPEK